MADTSTRRRSTEILPRLIEPMLTRPAPATAQARERLPFTDFLEPKPTPNHVVIGLKWEPPNGKIDRLIETVSIVPW